MEREKGLGGGNLGNKALLQIPFSFPTPLITQLYFHVYDLQGINENLLRKRTKTK